MNKTMKHMKVGIFREARNDARRIVVHSGKLADSYWRTQGG